MSHVLVIEEDNVLREALIDVMRQLGYDCLAATYLSQADDFIARFKPDFLLIGLQLDEAGQQWLQTLHQNHPSIPILVMAVFDKAHSQAQILKLGATACIPKPFSAETLMEITKHTIQTMNAGDLTYPVAKDTQSQALLALAKRVAMSDVSVMISGESGTGKEVLAQCIHQNSARKSYPFVAINCAAIPEHMLEATLFGYEKGAFTGAYKTMPGKFEQAHRGTILLDEVSEMSLALQAKLLRVLQEKEVERLGSHKLTKLDIRVLATTNRRLIEEIKSGRFREDLYYRLNVFPLSWPPLRERVADILPLAHYFIHVYAKQMNKIAPKLSVAASERLLHYSWPGNVRELSNCMQRSLILHQTLQIESNDLCLEHEENGLSGSFDKKINTLVQNEFDVIHHTLQKNQGHRQTTAQILGISERTLRYKLAKMREKGYLI